MSSTAVIGSRHFSDYTLLKSILDIKQPEKIISGGAAGADSLARSYSREKGIELQEFLPDYDSYARKAPIIRNKLIIDSADQVVAFWDGKSKGTKNAVDYALQQGKSVEVVDITREVTRSDIIGEPQDRSESWSRYLDSQRAKAGAASLLKIAKIDAREIPNAEDRYIFSSNFVKEWINRERYRVLESKDNIYLVMPSSSGNQFPLALANELKNSFGGQVITDFASQKHESGIKHLSGVKKVLTERTYTVNDSFKKSVEDLKGKNIVLVDDLVSTGITMDSFRRELNSFGIKANYICSLVNTSSSLANDNSIMKLAQSVAPHDPEYFEKMSSVLHNSLSGALFHLQRGIKSKDDSDAVKEFIDKKYSEYVSTLCVPYSPEKSLSDSIQGSISVPLPHSIRHLIDDSPLDQSKVINVIASSMEKVKSNEYTWVRENLPEGVNAIYQSGSAGSSCFVIRSDAQGYSAYEGKRYLGSDKELSSLKSCVENYAILNEIKSGLTTAIRVSKERQMSLDL